METIKQLTEIYLISRNLKTFERGFINCLTDKCTSCLEFVEVMPIVSKSGISKVDYFHDTENI